MRVFVTGAAGWVGSAVVEELIGGGHRVTGLARSDDKAAVCAATGAEVLRGTLDDLDMLRSAASVAEGGDPHRIQSRLLQVRRECRSGPTRDRDAGKRAGRIYPTAARHLRLCAARAGP